MAGTLNVGQLIPDVGTNLYLNAQQYGGNVIIGNTTTTLIKFDGSGTITANVITSNTVNATTVTSNVVATTVSTSNMTLGGNAIGAGDASIMKNRIINGAFTVSQYNGTSSVTPTDLSYPIDRFRARLSQTGKYSVQQNAGSVTPPVGFSNYLGVTSLSAYAVTSTDYFSIQQVIEGFNTYDLGFGTANAKTVTLSAWVYSSLTGTFGGNLVNNASSRCYPFTYTISSANTWTQISITIAGDTTGTWTGASNAGSLVVTFALGAGSTQSGTAGAWSGTFTMSATGATSVVGTNGATFYITGVQLEVGSSATGFEYRQYGQELALCQRYYYQIPSWYVPAGANAFVGTFHRVSMRATPTLGGGGAGFSTGFNNSEAFFPFQTTGAYLTALTVSAEL